MVRSGFNLAAVRRLVPGIALAAFGVFVLWQGAAYSTGSMARIGPGFMPVGVGWLLIAMGALVAGEAALAHEEPTQTLRLRPLVTVFAAILLWALTIEHLGHYVATFAVVFVSALGERDFRPVSTLLIALVLAVVGHVVFILGLGLPFDALPW